MSAPATDPSSDVSAGGPLALLQKPAPAPVPEVTSTSTAGTASFPLDEEPAETEKEPAVLPAPPGENEEQPNVVRAASWAHKTGAAIVDVAIAFALTVGYALVEAMELPEAEPAETTFVMTGVDRWLDVASRYSTFFFGMFVALALGIAAYETIAVALVGRTAGHKLMGLRLDRADGAKPGVLRSIARGLLSGIGLLAIGAGWLWAPFDRRRMGLHDKWTGLVLIEEPPAPPPLDPPEAPPISDDVLPPLEMTGDNPPEEKQPEDSVLV